MIDALEEKLSELASLWRSARHRGDPAEELTLRREYHATLKDLWDRGWRGEEMYVDMELPDEFMPDYYLQYNNQQDLQQWEQRRRSYEEEGTASPVPLEEAPRTVGARQVVDTPPLHLVLLPIEVYSTGALVRVRVQHTELPDQLRDQPERVWIPSPDGQGHALQILVGEGLRGHALSVVSGYNHGPSRWDVEFWLPKKDWSAAPTAWLIWPVTSLRLPLELSTHDLEAAAGLSD
ncbi:hypothetical protein [Pseudonocardia spinosispora]|uniref:hypothetical protein n=1 Tax=Pseudonocardia spinosispora TaxID=103441 RepID=UPI000491DA9E|nr:hypothetical protein [Pseudonocardia spinosispora]